MEKQLDIFVNKKQELGPKYSSISAESLFDNKKMIKNGQWFVFIDGAARGNPGQAGCGIYVGNDREEIIQKGFFLGEKTNNQAEYLALLLAIFLIIKKQQEIGAKNIGLTINSDSELLVRQMSGFYKVKNTTLQFIRQLIDEMLKGMSYKFVHITREKNKIADRLANLGIDKKIPLPKDFLDFIADFKDIVEIIRN